MTDDNAPLGEPLSEADRLAEIRARLAAASSTPWEAGDVWGWAGLVWTADGTRVWDGNGTRCSYCRYSDPVDVKVRDINGEEMLAHLHRQPEPWGLDSAISDADGGLVIQSVSDPADHNLILHAPADLEFLLNLVGVLEGQLATAQAEVVIRDGVIVGRDKAIDSLEAWRRNWKPLVDAHMKRCNGCDACDSGEDNS